MSNLYLLDESIAEVKIALDILEQTLELVLTEGWHFNSESDVVSDFPRVYLCL